MDGVKLDYAPAQRVGLGHYARLSLRVCIFFVVPVGLAFIAWQIIQRSALIFAERACMEYNVPAGGLVMPTAPIPLTRFDGFSGAYPSWPTLFLHERHQPGQSSVLVVVDVVPGSHPIKWITRVYSQAGWLRTARLLNKTEFTPPIFSNYLYANNRVGQPDPSDPTHFTIPLVLSGKQKIVDGYLLPSNALKFEWPTED